MREVPLPQGSLAARAFAVTQYADAFSLALPPGAPHDVDALVRALGTAMPWWASVLMRIRNRAVSLIGLKSADPTSSAPASHAPLRPGDHAGMFAVFARSDDEILMGGNDRHLDFRVSMLVRPEADGHGAVLSTVVHYNRRIGRFYFFFVRPFHRLIVPSMLRRLGRQLARRAAA